MSSSENEKNFPNGIGPLMSTPLKKKFLTEDERGTSGEEISRNNAIGEAQSRVEIKILNSCATTALTEKLPLVFQNIQTIGVRHLSREEAERIGVGVLEPRPKKTPYGSCLRKFRISNPGHRQGEDGHRQGEEAVVGARQ